MVATPFGRPTLVKAMPDPSRGDAVGHETIEILRRRGRWLITVAPELDGVTVDYVFVAPGAVLAVRMMNPNEGERSYQQDRDALDHAERGAQVVRLLLQADDLQDRCAVIPTLLVCTDVGPELATGSRRAGPVWVLDGARPQLWVDLVDLDLLAPQLRALLHETFQRAAQPATQAPAQRRQERGAA